MDNIKIGKLIYRLRKERGMTQLQLAEKLNISDKTVSKWERGLGCPELSLLQELSYVFNVNLDRLVSGELNTNKVLSGNMKKLMFYICPDCGNIITALADAGISCCGKKLKAMKPQKSDISNRLNTAIIESDFYITSAHPMTRDHYITFVALLTADTVVMKKQYPEWELQTRIPITAHGRLIWHCNQHGLFYMDI